MERTLAKIFFFIGIVLATSSSAFCERSEVETITGRIVAYSEGTMCLNGNAVWSMLIQVQDGGVSPQFVEVRFSLPCDKSPEWLNRKASFKKFRLTRDEEADSILKEFVDCVTPGSGPDKVCPPFLMWKRLRGVEHEKLPFGQRVPSYRSVDVPLVPVV